MEKFRDKIFYSVLGVSGGLAGIVYAGRCSGASCAACLGCALPAAGILTVKLFHNLKERRAEE